MQTPEQRLRRIVEANGGSLRIGVQDLLHEFRIEALNAQLVEAIDDLLNSAELRTAPALGHVGISDVLELSVTSEVSGPPHKEPIEEWSFWAKRCEALEAQHAAARSRLQTAAQRCADDGIDLGPSAPIQPSGSHAAVAAPTAAAGGGFVAVGYAESGPDADLDGNVDGGLFEKLGDLFS
jgi:hypothetical protein